jgi:hypothetical protein
MKKMCVSPAPVATAGQQATVVAHKMQGAGCAGGPRQCGAARRLRQRAERPRVGRASGGGGRGGSREAAMADAQGWSRPSFAPRAHHGQRPWRAHAGASAARWEGAPEAVGGPGGSPVSRVEVLRRPVVGRRQEELAHRGGGE